VAAVQWHVGSSYPQYNAEAYAKWHQYPPPYSGSYATPWAWIDGKSRGYIYSQWAGYVNTELTVATDIKLQMTGTYNPGTRQGTLNAVLFNSGLTTLNAALQVAITEDSINYRGPNGDPWHNHVCRDYVPNQNGTAITLPAGIYDTVTVNYSVNASWVERFVKVVAYVQSTATQADSSRPVYQGGAAPILSFTGVEEPRVPASFYDNVTVSAGPNPCRANAQFSFTGKPGEGYHLSIFAPDGRLVREFSGAIGSGRNTFNWDRTDANGLKVGRGVYGYRLVSTGCSATGKVVLTD
jgi:hypothetical protein